jgi:hypothetical protein
MSINWVVYVFRFRVFSLLVCLAIRTAILAGWLAGGLCKAIMAEILNGRSQTVVHSYDWKSVSVESVSSKWRRVAAVAVALAFS